MRLQDPPEKQFIVSGGRRGSQCVLPNIWLISDMAVRLRTSLVTKRALLTTNAMGYQYTDHKQILEACITLVQYHAISTYIDTVHSVHMRAHAVSGPSHANGPHSAHTPNDTIAKAYRVAKSTHDYRLAKQMLSLLVVRKAQLSQCRR